MPAIPAPVQLKCDGCGTYYDSADDLAGLQVGAARHQLCEACWHTATGPGDRSFAATKDAERKAAEARALRAAPVA